MAGEEKAGLNPACFFEPWYFKAWEIIAVTQFSNVKARQHYFNRLSHLSASLRLFFFFSLSPPLPFVSFPIANIRG